MNVTLTYRIFAHISRGLYSFLHENGRPAGYTKVWGVQIAFYMIHWHVSGVINK